MIDGAGHTRRDDLKSSREATDTTLDGNLFHSLAVLAVLFAFDVSRSLWEFHSH